ncbi:ATP-grasp domain-containing protein [Pseudomonas syringae]|uniref:ATP-grasp domain-containing protein n=1 Tax=Pseudomonas syringae TaxID=317 RepID=UPI000BB5A3B8|nr:ATP-grasp domain-containing protein [Pseudomonas syringae]PBP30703.1 biotin carboxylase [Pseudomonas syringae]
MKHVLIINRYDDELSDYRNYIDHSQVDVSYISLAGHSRLIDPQISANVVEVSVLDADLILQEARAIHRRQPVDFVIAFSEYDLDAAALVRTEFNIPGAKVADNLLCRNKASMKEALTGSSVRYPQYRNLASRSGVEAFCREHGFPVILKPQVGAASDGVVKIERLEDIPDLPDFNGYEVEEYIEGDIYHVDAIRAADSMPYFKVSKYLNTCLDFRNGLPLGSVTVDDRAFVARVRAFTEEVCLRLNLHNQAIHLEIIERRGELVFLEIGGRVGGGEIPFVALRSEGIDLYELWTRAALEVAIAPLDTRITGFLMMPNPFPGGFTFDPQMELSHPLLTYSSVQSQGDSSAFSYEDIPARLHFAADSQAAIEQAIVQCMNILQTSIRAT